MIVSLELRLFFPCQNKSVLWFHLSQWKQLSIVLQLVEALGVQSGQNKETIQPPWNNICNIHESSSVLHFYHSITYIINAHLLAVYTYENFNFFPVSVSNVLRTFWTFWIASTLVNSALLFRNYKKIVYNSYTVYCLQLTCSILVPYLANSTNFLSSFGNFVTMCSANICIALTCCHLHLKNKWHLNYHQCHLLHSCT